MANPDHADSAPAGPLTPDQADIETAYMGIPDQGNEPIQDLREIYRITVVSIVIFVAVVFVFIL